MSKHHRSEHRHRSSGTSVDWKKHRLFHDGKEYAFNSYTESLTPCTWTWRRGRNHSWHAVHMVLETKELDNILLLAFATEQEAKRVSESQSADSESSDEAASKKNTSWQKHTQGRPKKGQRIERTKYGVRVYSIDGKTWWDFCVNDSNTYPGSAAVRLTLPPPRKDGKRWHMAVFDLETMEAIRREFARGPHPKKHERP